MAGFRVNNLFRVQLAAPAFTSPKTAAAQAHLDTASHNLRRHFPSSLSSDNLLVAAAASRMRQCRVGRGKLPIAFMVRFVRAHRPDGQAVLAVDPVGDRYGRGMWVSACHSTVAAFGTRKGLHRARVYQGRRAVEKRKGEDVLEYDKDCEVRPDLADHAWVQHLNHLHALVGKAVLRQRCVLGSAAILEHVERESRRRQGVLPPLQPPPAVALDHLSLLVPIAGGNANDLADKMQFWQKTTWVGAVAVAPVAVDWDAVGGPGADPPDFIAMNGDAYSRRVYFTALRVAGLTPGQLTL